MEDDYPSADDQHTDYDKQPAHRPNFGKKSGRKRWIIIASIAAGLLLVGGGAYWLLAGGEQPASTPSTTGGTSGQPSDGSLDELEAASPDANATSKTFKSDKLKIEFTYRSDWAVKESADAEEVVVTSPRTTYTTKDGASTEGVFTLKLRNGVIPEAMQTTVHSAVAVKDSEVIAYDQPTEAQRHYTNLSFGGPDSKNFSFFIVSGSVAYKAGQPFGSQINLFGTAYVFAGGYGADSTDALLFEPVPAGSSATPTYERALAIIKSLKLY